MLDVRLQVRGNDHSDEVESYIQERVDRLEKFNERVTSATFELRSEQHRSGGKQWIAQFTVSTPGKILRSEMRDRDQFHAIDVAVEKMRKQVRRFHARKVRRSRRQSVNLGVLAAEQQRATRIPDLDEEKEHRVVRTKTFEFHPMDVEEAIDQMELLEHDFFVFRHAESGDTEVVYRRADGSYGRIRSA